VGPAARDATPLDRSRDRDQRARPPRRRIGPVARKSWGHSAARSAARENSARAWRKARPQARRLGSHLFQREGRDRVHAERVGGPAVYRAARRRPRAVRRGRGRSRAANSVCPAMRCSSPARTSRRVAPASRRCCARSAAHAAPPRAAHAVVFGPGSRRSAAHARPPSPSTRRSSSSAKWTTRPR
jgi:hypothetical protein